MKIYIYVYMKLKMLNYCQNSNLKFKKKSAYSAYKCHYEKHTVCNLNWKNKWQNLNYV